MKKIFVLLIFALCIVAEAKILQLPPANTTGGMPLMEALASRSSSRDFTPGATLTSQELSDLLWCANGFNREDKRTAPSAVNAQAIDIYVFDAEGIWLYLPKEQALKAVVHGDNRTTTGMQSFVKDAAVNFVYVYDLSKWPMQDGTGEKWAAADASFCAENVYLYCASAGLKTVVRGSFQGNALRQLLNLPENMIVVLAQSVGR